MATTKLTAERRKPTNQIINRQLTRTMMVKRELIEKLVAEQNATMPALEVPPQAIALRSWWHRLMAKLTLRR